MGGKLTGLAGIMVWPFERDLLLIVAVLPVFKAPLHVFFDFRDAGMFLNVVETSSFNECGAIVCSSMHTDGVL